MAPTERITVTVEKKQATRWWLELGWLLVGQYPDSRDDDRIVVVVEDAATGARWTIPVSSISQGRRARGRILDAARTMVVAEVDEWSRTGRWTTLA